MTDEQMPRTTAVRESLQSIPAEKRKRMRLRTLWGVLFIALGIAMGMKWIFADAPVLVSLGMVLFGAVMASGQLMKHPFKLMAAAFADYQAAKTGKRPDEDDE